ncbi:MAG: hypothetical protein D3M94_18525 [Rhodocyclales bacterium GT-UBC]|nr:MAG: hypothetical protein D3M94_18525 [Rhodocyclales bacterium GT-UBC]
MERAGKCGTANHDIAQGGWRLAPAVEEAGQHGRDQREMCDGIAGQVVDDLLQIETVVQEHTGASPGAAPEDGLAADVVERQAIQPQIVGAKGQALV